MSVRFYFDEDSTQHRVTAALRSHSINVLTSLEAGMNARDDEEQLALAAAQGRVLVTANVRDFAAIHRAWLSQGRAQAGILILSQQRYGTGEIVRRLVRLAWTKPDLAGGIHYLSNY